ncbi:MAG: ribbon-helix-helix protein, CopG family [Acidimicrobiia bacterium]|nr:ribbon-helix-helix protein, CopG family [Acidimicrobiia bacterium]
MTQLVTRISDDLARRIDALVDERTAASRSDLVRIAIEQFLDRHRRQLIGQRIKAGYTESPQTESDVGWPDEATRRMITEEPW